MFFSTDINNRRIHFIYRSLMSVSVIRECVLEVFFCIFVLLISIHSLSYKKGDNNNIINIVKVIRFTMISI
jgi:hypothetical protein